MRPSKSVSEKRYLMKLVPMNPHPPVTNKFCIDPPQVLGSAFPPGRRPYGPEAGFWVLGFSISDFGFRIESHNNFGIAPW
jgi:hypothetical protein